jgi:hypothetical protein
LLLSKYAIPLAAPANVIGELTEQTDCTARVSNKSYGDLHFKQVGLSKFAFVCFESVQEASSRHVFGNNVLYVFF